MNTILKTAILLISGLVMAVPAHAQDITYLRYLENLNEINSYRPEQSAKHERSEEILNDRILDSTNRVVGEVKDVLLTRSGSIETLNADFNRLKLGTDELFVDYGDLSMRPVSNGYKMSYSDDQIEDLVPALLANMATAAGGDQDSYSLKKLIGAKVKAKDGRTLGNVEDVLFDNLGGRAELLFIEMKYRSARGESLAIPFSLAKYSASGKTIAITVPDQMADAMITHAKDN